MKTIIFGQLVGNGCWVALVWMASKEVGLWTTILLSVLALEVVGGNIGRAAVKIASLKLGGS